MGIMEACLQFPMTGSPGTCMVAQMVLKQGNLYPDLQAEKEAGESGREGGWDRLGLAWTFETSKPTYHQWHTSTQKVTPTSTMTS